MARIHMLHVYAVTIDLQPQTQVGVVLGDVWELSQGCTQNCLGDDCLCQKSLSSALKHNTMNM